MLVKEPSGRLQYREQVVRDIVNSPVENYHVVLHAERTIVLQEQLAENHAREG